jgi:hypothetical protein
VVAVPFALTGAQTSAIVVRTITGIDHSISLATVARILVKKEG